MPRIFRVAVLLTVTMGGAMTATTVQAQRVQADGALQTFNTLADQYFDDVYFRFSPTSGTAAGLHQYDTQLEDYSAASVREADCGAA